MAGHTRALKVVRGEAGPAFIIFDGAMSDDEKRALQVAAPSVAASPGARAWLVPQSADLPAGVLIAPPVHGPAPEPYREVKTQDPLTGFFGRVERWLQGSSAPLLACRRIVHLLTHRCGGRPNADG